jgi:hypothetical protein
MTNLELPRRLFPLAASLAALCLTAASVSAQSSSSSPNTGALTFTGGLDAPSVYVFRGIVQEADPGVTLSPYGDIGIRLKANDDGSKKVGLNIGVWNSLQTGSSGSDGFSGHLHYEEDFYASLSYALTGRLTAAATYTAYTSPNFMFDTVKEASLKVAHSGRFSPYGLVAFELGDNGADGGVNKGTYVEFGAAPSFPLGRMTLAVPAKIGLSASDYYELNGVDHRFGYFDIGATLTLPLSGASSSFGSWNIHGGLDFLSFGDTTKAFNAGEKTKVVGLVGIGVAY